MNAYWWEGYSGYETVLRRLVRFAPPYIHHFGDRISPFILSRLTDEEIVHSTKEGKLLALGSIFFALRDRDLVWGTGLLNPSRVYFAKKAKGVRYLAVRGPQTRMALLKNGIECPEVYGDPTLLLPTLVRNDIPKKVRIGIVPHFTHFDFFRRSFRKNPDIPIIDVQKPFAEVVRSILGCETVLATSLQGLIIAEAYGIPALFLTLGNANRADLFEFEDYFSSTDRSFVCGKFDEPKQLETLIEATRKVPAPKFNPDPLLRAFPSRIASTKKPISWSQVSTTGYPKTLLVPPLFSMPKGL